MQQLKTVWSGLDRRKQIIVAIATVAVFGGVLAMSRLASTPSMGLLYAGLESGAAGDVVQALEQGGTPYEVRGGSIFVPVDQRDALRMTLASAGLPANGGRGYELLDSLSGFGTTSQMFDAAYWRAKEGELARTIVSSPHVAQARVHIANTGSNPFQRSVKPTASVSVTPTGMPITVDQANALRYLVASAVAGLASDDVAVIDVNGALIGMTDAAASGGGDDRARQMRESVLRLIEARVGRGNAVVEVSVDVVTETESIRERRFDPESRVAISTDTEERSDSSTNQSNGSVTVASNLPDGDGAGQEGSQAQTSETRERVNYEVSETEHEILREPGAVRRITVAVLVNGLEAIGPDGGRSYEARSEAEMAALEDLVASAVGFDPERGDVITLRSMEMPVSDPVGTPVVASLLQNLKIDALSLIQIAALALVTLILGLFVVRPILTSARLAPPAPALPPVRPEQSPEPMTALTGEIDDGDATHTGAGAQIDSNTVRMGIPGTNEAGSDDAVDRLRAMIGEKQVETVEILRGWLEENGERT